MQIECDFAPFRIQILTLSHPCNMFFSVRLELFQNCACLMTARSDGIESCVYQTLECRNTAYGPVALIMNKWIKTTMAIRDLNNLSLSPDQDLLHSLTAPQSLPRDLFTSNPLAPSWRRCQISNSSSHFPLHPPSPPFLSSSCIPPSSFYLFNHKPLY